MSLSRRLTQVGRGFRLHFPSAFLLLPSTLDAHLSSLNHGSTAKYTKYAKIADRRSGDFYRRKQRKPRLKTGFVNFVIFCLHCRLGRGNIAPCLAGRRTCCSDLPQQFTLSSPAKREKTGALAKSDFLNLQSKGLLRGTQLLFSLEPMFLVMARLLSGREPDFIGLRADFRLGWSRIGLL